MRLTRINPGGYPGGTFVTPVAFPSFTSFNRYNEYAVYAQDNWSIGRRVKLNLGVRYEYFGPQKPCSTGVVVKGLALDDFVVEIDAYGVIDD